ncbi:hypothetical protein ACQX0N_04390 [Clostridium tepidum]|jgi:predicted RND superfamily exporter protein|uniref:Uncharacterized protein n=1 Tax=Clostridium tepidum TaxID=1962263 RepID=A0A1S9IHK4_9CLOT|nr:hypothetical protein [Clostridium tepidum]MCR1933683.1 hypothetical protein [Clostridium tepidum]MDU6876791.1 hypothetical protein [Clostridium botulinum]OOO63622.1 hypothetical protein BS637_00940 [Clostridium tepidum]OOO69770.1 hypothetical protein BS638_01490 [Clostridium tepidum]
MEFRLNKIDLELRDKIKEQTKEGKVHSKQNITINKQDKNNNSKGKEFYEQLKKKQKSNKRNIKIKAVKYVKGKNLNIEATKEETEGKTNIVGTIIDTTK